MTFEREAVNNDFKQLHRDKGQENNCFADVCFPSHQLGSPRRMAQSGGFCDTGRRLHPRWQSATRHEPNYTNNFNNY
jgi:hypothetical protein